MPSKTTTALAILLVFGSGSAALAQTNNRTSHPFTAEEKGWFDRASRVF